MRLTMQYLNRFLKGMRVCIPDWLKHELLNDFNGEFILADDGLYYQHTEEDICHQTHRRVSAYVANREREVAKWRKLLEMRPWE
jgi:hypothetical protein